MVWLFGGGRNFLYQGFQISKSKINPFAVGVRPVQPAAASQIWQGIISLLFKLDIRHRFVVGHLVEKTSRSQMVSNTFDRIPGAVDFEQLHFTLHDHGKFRSIYQVAKLFSRNLEVKCLLFVQEILLTPRR